MFGGRGVMTPLKSYRYSREMGDARKPARSYLVCATPRSGSTLLCELLAATGVAGRPEEPFERLLRAGLPRQPRDYFDRLADPAGGRLAPLEPGAPERPEASRALWREALARGTTSNGVFAAKLMWGYFPDFLARLR